MPLIGHFSDLHGKLNSFLNSKVQPDIWVCTGDLFPDPPMDQILTKFEHIQFQREWFFLRQKLILDRLGKTPLVWCPGNHDVVHLSDLLSACGHDAHRVTPGGVAVSGVLFAGFGNTPIETSPEDLKALVETTMRTDPHVILLHAPPSGALDIGCPESGIPTILNYLRQPHRAKLLLCGHLHGDGGKSVDFHGTGIYNGACTTRFIGF